MTDIFISYSRKDLAIAANLAAALDDLGYAVWWDRRNLRGGQAFAREIERVIKRASCVIVIWSHHSVKSEWVYAEASLAYQQGNLLTAACDEADVPLPFNTRHNEDLKQWGGDLRHAGLQKLLQSVGRCCSQAAYQEHMAPPQIPNAVLYTPTKSGLAWSSIFSIMLGAVSLAVAGGAFYLQAETQENQIIDDLLASLGLSRNMSSESGAKANVGPKSSAQSVQSAGSNSPLVVPEHYQLMITVEPGHIAHAVITVDGELWVQGNDYAAGRQYKVVVSAIGYQLEETNVDIINVDVPVPFVLTPVVDSLADAPASIVAASIGQEVQAAPVEVELERSAFEPDMVEIPAGSFIPSRCAADKKRADGACAAVEVDVFQIAQTEITVAQFTQFVVEDNYKTTAEEQGWCWGIHNSEGEWGRFFQGTWRQASFAQDKKHPVVCVSSKDVRAYIHWLNLKTGRRYALPTEEQWEYAALGGLQKTTQLVERCGYANTADKKARENYPAWEVSGCHDRYTYTAPVGKFAANGYGLHDMHGNVWEWVQNYTQGGYEIQVIRGDSWGYDPKIVRSSDRAIWEGNSPSEDIGFRLIKVRN